LPASLERLAELYETELELRRQLRYASTYPLAAASLLFGICLLLTTFFVPQLAGFYNDFSGGEAQLPAFTRLVLNWSEWIGGGGWLALALLPGLAWLLRLVRNAPWIRPRLDALVLRLPLFGLLTRKVELARCGRALAALLATGVPVDSALALAASCTVNTSVQRAWQRVLVRVSRGLQLAAALEGERALTPLLPSVVAASQDAAGAAQNLDRLAQAYELDSYRTLRVLVRQVEPALIVGVGLWAGAIAVAAYLPIFNLVDVIQ
jgi:type IV pilus assembly protein PilC